MSPSILASYLTTSDTQLPQFCLDVEDNLEGQFALSK